MSMEYFLELNIISAKDLNNVNRFTTMKVYCDVSLSGDSVHPKTATTHVHKKGGTSPIWNFPIMFTVDECLLQQERLSLKVELISDRIIAGDTAIGTVHIPLKELLENPAAEVSFRQISYQVRKPSGKAKGTLVISYKLSKRVMPYPPPGTAAGSSSVPSGTAYPPPQPGGYANPLPPTAGYIYPPQPGQNPQKKRRRNKIAALLGVIAIRDAVGEVATMLVDWIVSGGGDDDA